jgi:hypothetical protein
MSDDPFNHPDILRVLELADGKPITEVPAELAEAFQFACSKRWIWDRHDTVDFTPIRWGGVPVVERRLIRLPAGEEKLGELRWLAQRAAATTPSPPGDDQPPGPETAPSADKRPSMLVQEVTARLERLRSQGERFPGQRQLADRIGCSVGNVNNALQTTDLLVAWSKSKQSEAAPRVVVQSRSPGSGVAEQAAISREPDPSDAAAEAELRELIEKNVGERAFCHEMRSRAPDFLRWYTGQPPGDRRDIRQAWADITASDPDARGRFFTQSLADQIASFDNAEPGPEAHP